MIDTTFEIQGLDELDDKLAELTDVMKRKVIEQSLMAASLPMMKKAKDNALTASQKLGEKMYAGQAGEQAAGGASAGGASAGGAGAQTAGDDTVVDAEFKEVKDGKA